MRAYQLPKGGAGVGRCGAPLASTPCVLFGRELMSVTWPDSGAPKRVPRITIEPLELNRRSQPTNR